MSNAGSIYSSRSHYLQVERKYWIKYDSFSYLIGGLNPAIVVILELVTYFSEDNVPNIALLYTVMIVIGSFLGSALASLFFSKVYFKHMKTWRNFSSEWN